MTPLAECMRPTTPEDCVRQEYLAGTQGALNQQIARGFLPSPIFWGPPDTGKTTLVNIIAHQGNRAFYTLSAISSGIKEVREAIKQNKRSGGLFATQNLAAFIDEVHHFNKTQQDSLLQAVEEGWITLIRVTTEGPNFEVIPALLPHCRVCIFNAFERKDLEQLLQDAIAKDSVLKTKDIQLEETGALLKLSDSDGRELLNTFEPTVSATPEEQSVIITNDNVLHLVQKNTVLYDKTDEQHYDTISVFIKSIQGSDPNGAVYWLARMIEGGEDMKFIARRMLILASGDMSNANPTAIILASNTFQVVTTTGYPETRIILSQYTIYLASSARSNASYKAVSKTQQVVKQTDNLSVPIHLCGASAKLMKELGYGKDYQYAHDYEDSFTFQDYLSGELQGETFYGPSNNPRENALRKYLKKHWDNRYGC